MITLDEIKQQLSDRNLKAVAENAGVHYNSLYRMMNGGTRPSYEMVRKLADYLEGK